MNCSIGLDESGVASGGDETSGGVVDIVELEVAAVVEVGIGVLVVVMIGVVKEGVGDVDVDDDDDDGRRGAHSIAVIWTKGFKTRNRVPVRKE
jgi:hypothetical protein